MSTDPNHNELPPSDADPGAGADGDDDATTRVEAADDGAAEDGAAEDGAVDGAVDGAAVDGAAPDSGAAPKKPAKKPRAPRKKAAPKVEEPEVEATPRESTTWTRRSALDPVVPSISELSEEDLYHGDDEDEEESGAASGKETAVEPLELDLEDESAEQEMDFQWYILKVQVNREDSICQALWRRVRMHGMEDFFSEIIVPTEEVAEFTKSGKRRVVKKKKFPGYIMAKMAVTDESWFLVRETSGIGDFTGAGGKPTPMDPREVEKIIVPPVSEEDGEAAQPRPAIPFSEGERVRVKDGHFQNFEGEVSAVDETHGRVTVMINIFGRPTPVQLEHWQIESL